MGCERGHAFEEKIKVVRAEGGVVSVIVDVPACEGLEEFPDSGVNIASSTERVTGHPADARVEDHHGAILVHLAAMRLHVSERADRPLFLTAEQDEANSAARQKSASFNCARCFDDHGRVATIVQRT